MGLKKYIISLLLLFVQSALAVPQLYWPDDYTGSHTEQTLIEMILKVESVFKSRLEANNTQYSIDPYWEGPESGSHINSSTDGKNFTVQISGGGLRNPVKEFDGMLIGITHEFGHLLQELPLKHDSLSSEGQADYIAGRELKKVLQLFSKHSSNDKHSSLYEKLCKQVPPSEKKICHRAMRAIENFGEFIADYKQIEIVPQLDTPDNYIATETITENYPNPQCRIDTMLAGYFRKDRPGCWYR